MATEANNLKQVPLPKNTMVVARPDGKLYVVDFTEFPHLDDPAVVDWNLSVSKLMVGKVQNTRVSVQTLEGVECENIVHTEQYPVGTTKDFQLVVFGTIDSKTPAMEVEVPIIDGGDGYVHAPCRLSARSFDILIRGTFNVNTLVVTTHPAGSR